MKKISAVLLIAVLAGGLVFAGFSGSATVGLGANFDTKEYGFIGNGTSVTVDMKFFEELGSAASEGKVYAEINGSLILGFDTGKADPGEVTVGDEKNNYAPYVAAKIDSAKIGGENWSVTLLGLADGPDFAKSAIEKYTDKEKTGNLNAWGYTKGKSEKEQTYALPYAKAPGVEVSIYDYTVGFGLKGKSGGKNDIIGNVDATAYAKTPEFELVDGLKLQVAAAYSQNALVVADDPTKDAIKAVGGSVKVSYASDAFSATVASDIGYNLIDGAADPFGADVALNVAVAPVTLDAYYATKTTTKAVVKNLLSTKVVADLNEFDVPVKVTFTGKNLVNTQDLSAEVEVAVMDGLTVTPKGGYVIDSEKWSAGLDAKYAADAFTVAGGVALSQEKGAKLMIGAKASIESTTLVPGATLKLAWSDGDDLTKVKPYAKADADGNGGHNNFGKVMASVKVAF